jgi:hypothetical protein
MHLLSKGLDLAAQLPIEGHRLPATCTAIEDGSPRHLDSEHFFQAKRLGAELETVRNAAEFISASFVLDRVRTPEPPAALEH